MLSTLVAGSAVAAIAAAVAAALARRMPLGARANVAMYSLAALSTLAFALWNITLAAEDGIALAGAFAVFGFACASGAAALAVRTLRRSPRR